MPKTPIKFKDSFLGKIPEDWDAVPLSSLFQIQTGATPLRNKHQAYFAGGTTPWVKTIDLNEGWIINTDECITETALRECSVQLLPSKTVLVAMYGGWEQIGRTGILQNAATTNQAISSLVKISPLIEPEFALCALQYERHRWKGIAASTRKDPNITRDDVEIFLIPLPPLSEQQDIVTILEKIDSTISHTSALIAKLKQMKAGLLHDLLTRGLDENGELRDAIAHPGQFKPSPLGQIPQDWNTPLIGDIAIYVGSGITPFGGSRVYKDQGTTFIRSQNVTFEGLILNDVAYIDEKTHECMKRSEVFAHDVLLNITGASIGRCCPLPDGIGLANVNQHVCAIRLPEATPEDAQFLAAVLSSSIGQHQIDRLNAGGNREGLNYQQLRAFLVPYPKAEERREISKALSLHNARIYAEETYLGKIKEQKKGLMHDLLTGKVRADWTKKN